MSVPPRYEWPAQALTPHAEPRPQVQPEPVTPVAPDTTATRAPVPLADGWHEHPNGDWRWWVERRTDALHPVVTAQGWDGPRWVMESREMEGASPAKVHRWIEGVIAGLAAEAARKRAKGRRS